MPRCSPLHKSVGVFLERRVIPGIADDRLFLAGVLSGAPGDSTAVLARLDARIVAKPLHTIVFHLAPETIVDPFQGVHQRRPHGIGSRAQGPDGEVMPPHIGFGKWTHGGTGETTAPVIVHVGPQLIAREPVDLVLFDAIVHDFVVERDAIGRARVGAFTANFAEILDAVVNGLVRHQR